MCGRGALLPNSICETVTRATPARSANVCCDICRRCRASRSVSIPTSPSHVPSAESRCGGTGIDSTDRILRSTHSNCKPLYHGMKRYTDGLFAIRLQNRLRGQLLSPRTFTAYVLASQKHDITFYVVACRSFPRSYAMFARMTQPISTSIAPAIQCVKGIVLMQRINK